MDGDATTDRDVADDRITRQGLAAAGHLRQQVADALDLDIAALARARCTGAARDQLQLFVATLRLDLLLGQVDRMGQAQVAGTEGGVHVLDRLQVALFRQLGEVHRRQRQARQVALEHGLAGGDVLLAILQLEPVDDLRPRAAGGDVAQVGVEPVAAGCTVLAGDDLHLLAGVQAVGQRHDAPVDLGAAAVVADLGVHAVGEVQRRGTLGQVDGMAVRGEHVDPVRLDIDLELLGQATDVAQLLVPLQHLAQPGHLLFVVVGAALGVGTLVLPVGTHAQLGLFMHGIGADLHLQHLAIRADHRGVQGAVAVFLGVGDVVVELLGNVPPQGMHDAERGVAVAHFRHQHAHRAHVVDLAELQALALHFPPDRIDVLGAAADVGLDAGGGEFVAQLLHHIVDVLLAVEAALVQQLGDLLVLLRLQVAEGDVLQLPLDMADAEAVSQRRVDVEHLAGHAQALLVVGMLDRADGAGALGQLDQRHAHVVDHGHQHLAQVLHLRLRADHHRLARVDAVADGGHAQHAFDQLGHHRAELLLHHLERGLALAHGAVDHRRHQAVLVQLEVGEDLGDLQAGLETGVALRPEVLRGIGLLLDLAGELAGHLEGLAVERRVDAQRMVQPGLEVDAAVEVDRLVCSDLYHFLPSLRRVTPRRISSDLLWASRITGAS